MDPESPVPATGKGERGDGSSKRRIFVRGMGSMALFLGFAYIFHRFVPALDYPASRLGAAIRDLIPGSIASKAIESAVRLSNRTGIGFLEHAALAGLSVLAHLLWLIIGGISALAVERAGSPAGRERRRLIAGSAVFALSLVLLATGPGGVGVFSMLILAAGAGLYSASVTRASIPRGRGHSLERFETPLDAIRRSRRRFLRRVAGAAGALVTGVSLARFFTKSDPSASVRIVSADEAFSPPPPDRAFGGIAGLSNEITPVEDFYNVDINITKPAIDHATWKLMVQGMLDKPFDLDYRQLQDRFSVVEMASTLTCISNEVGGDLVSTAVWRGVRLRDVLLSAGIRPEAREVVFRAADGYSDSIPLEKALAPDTLIAFGMNGSALPRRNGFPARMVIPGIYGMKNVKWLLSIEVTGQNYRGYWQKRGWSDVALVKTQSRIDVPRRNATLRGPMVVAGVAWAGDRRISSVEISDDGGKTWRPARLKRELSPNAWRLWSADLPGDKQGGKKLLVRATDGRNRTQDRRRTRTHPDGASGLHAVSVRTEPEERSVS